ncbi:MAG: glutathione S-transferase [Bradymonadia bacterium]
MTLPILYSFRRCPFAIRARLALAEGGIQVELREVVLRNKPAEMLEVSPKGTVPVLVLPKGRVIEESLEVMQWASETGAAWLAGEEDSELVSRNDTFFKENLDRYKYASRYDADPVFHRTAAMEFIAELELLLAGQTFLSGDTFGYADAAIAPFVRQFSGADRDWFNSVEQVNVRAWLEAFVASQRFKRVMPKFVAWSPGGATVVWPQ